MRLVRTLLKAVVVLAFAAAALGGAAALGSTLFEEPPRDAADFAQRVQAASERTGDTKRTKAERRYARALNALCLRQRPAEEALGTPKSVAEIPAWYRRAKPVFRRHRAQFAARRPPRSYRDEVAELLALERRAIRLFDRLVARLGAGDRAAFDEMRLGSERLSGRSEQLLVALGGLGCIHD
ncbi:MAG: hypothetical protein ACRDMU_08070 [Gaiellaceae bacterium]